MIALTLRQRNIIEYLLSRDSYVTNDVIASNFEVSNRTVRKDLEVISAYLKGQGISLVRKPGKGVWIEDKQEVLFDDLSCSYSKNERIVIYVTSLLLNDVNTFMTLASSCGVSKQTVINDLNTIEKFLDGYHLSLIKIRVLVQALKEMRLIFGVCLLICCLQMIIRKLFMNYA